jgi:hypothetical protein
MGIDVKARKFAAAVATVAIGMVALAGCSLIDPEPIDPEPTAPTTSAPVDTVERSGDQVAALADYVAAERAEFPRLLELFDGYYAQITAEAELTAVGASIVFTYIYAEDLDAAATADVTRQLVEDPAELQDSVAASVFPAMEAFGLEGALYVTYEYFNPDGSPVASRTLMRDLEGRPCNFAPVPAAELPQTCDGTDG